MERPMKHEPWQVTAEAAELYERYPARYMLGPWAPLLVDPARLKGGERVLGGACGPGLGGRHAAQRVGPAGQVVGVDLNPGMIAVARSLPAPTGAPVEWLEGSALDLQLPDAGFDAVLCQQGLQFFPDKLVALREMRRVLDHGGRLALSVWTGIGPYTLPSATCSLGSSAPPPPRSFARLGKCRPGMSSTALQRTRAFPTWRFTSLGLIFTCPVWISSYWIICGEHRSRP